jgi:hypothetical protein
MTTNACDVIIHGVLAAPLYTTPGYSRNSSKCNASIVNPNGIHFSNRGCGLGPCRLNLLNLLQWTPHTVRALCNGQFQRCHSTSRIHSSAPIPPWPILSDSFLETIPSVTEILSKIDSSVFYNKKSCESGDDRKMNIPHRFKAFTITHNVDNYIYSASNNEYVSNDVLLNG